MLFRSYVSYGQLERMESSVRAHSRWTLLYNCSAFARDVWNDMLNDDLSADGPWPSPKSLSYHMRQREGVRSEGPCARGGRRVTRGLAGLLGVAFALWFATSLFNFEINPQGAILARGVRVSDDTVSFDVSLFGTIGFLSDCSWEGGG